MTKCFLPLAAMVVTACGPLFDPGSAIQIDFSLYASDELALGLDGGACLVQPATSNSGLQKQSGMLELDPVLNPNAQYVLNLQVENDAAVGDDGNDFHAQKATIRYLDTEGNLPGVADNAALGGPSDVALVSGLVKSGTASAIAVTAVGPNETIPWLTSFLTNTNLGPNTGATETVLIQIQITGVLSSGSTASTAAFDFPLTLCFGCENLPLKSVGSGSSVLWEPNCPDGTTPVAQGHGPCCAPQDFYVSCVTCGSEPGEACCGGPGLTSCGTGLACTGPAPAGVEVCPLFPAAFTEPLTCAAAA